MRERKKSEREREEAVKHKKNGLKNFLLMRKYTTNLVENMLKNVIKLGVKVKKVICNYFINKNIFFY